MVLDKAENRKDKKTYRKNYAGSHKTKRTLSIKSEESIIEQRCNNIK